MNRAQRRAAGATARPNMIPEPIRAQFKDQPHMLNRRDTIEFVTMLCANLQNLLNQMKNLPWIQASIDRRTDGFSLHVQVVEPTLGEDAEVTIDGQTNP